MSVVEVYVLLHLIDVLFVWLFSLEVIDAFVVLSLMLSTLFDHSLKCIHHLEVLCESKSCFLFLQYLRCFNQDMSDTQTEKINKRLYGME